MRFTDSDAPSRLCLFTAVVDLVNCISELTAQGDPAIRSPPYRPYLSSMLTLNFPKGAVSVMYTAFIRTIDKSETYIQYGQ